MPPDPGGLSGARNGKTVAQTDRLTLIRDGHIALQVHRENATSRFNPTSPTGTLEIYFSRSNGKRIFRSPQELSIHGAVDAVKTL